MRRRRVAPPAQVSDRLGEVRDRDRLDPGERDLDARLRWTDDALETRPTRTFGGDESTGHGPQATIERELADRGVPGERLGRQLARGGQNRQSDRDVEAGALLPEPGRRKVDGQAATRPFELGRGDPATDAMLGFLTRTVRQADDRERGRPALEVRFDLDPARIETDEGVRDGAAEHVATLDDNA